LYTTVLSIMFIHTSFVQYTDYNSTITTHFRLIKVHQDLGTGLKSHSINRIIDLRDLGWKEKKKQMSKAELSNKETNIHFH
jgi:hypothetical protein